MEVLSLGDAVHLDAPLDQRAGNAAQPEIHREPGADRPAADDNDLILFHRRRTVEEIGPEANARRRREYLP